MILRKTSNLFLKKRYQTQCLFVRFLIDAISVLSSFAFATYQNCWFQLSIASQTNRNLGSPFIVDDFVLGGSRLASGPGCLSPGFGQTFSDRLAFNDLGSGRPQG